MLRPGALLLLLAAAVSQVELSVQTEVVLAPSADGQLNISTCAITFYGRRYTSMQVSFNGSDAFMCFIHASEIKPACVSIDRQTANNTRVSVSTVSTTIGSPLHVALPSINTTSRCFVALRFYNQTQQESFEVAFFDFGTQAALRLNATDFPAASYSMKATVANVTVRKWTFNETQARNLIFVEVSGCRNKGSVMLPNRSISTPSTCYQRICSATAVFRSGSVCSGREICKGSNGCYLPPFVCTVTGSTVFDFFGRNSSISDRCLYSLMKPETGSSFELKAGFMERRRKDVPLLDYLLLELSSGETFYLEQGGRVKMNNQTLALNSTARLVKGVRLSRDQTGVTAGIPSSRMTVFFDGNTARVSGPVEALEGLCGNPTKSSWTPSAVNSTSFPGCEIRHNDVVDAKINCTLATARCNLINQAPFTDCHRYTDPAPYVAACTNTLCKYPAVDGHKCQFLEAYAESCRLAANITVGSWRSSAGCPAVPRAFCHDRYCSSHEFCGEKLVGTRCFCRAIFASKYRQNGTFGEPTVCTRNSASIALTGCLLEDQSINYSVLHLNDKNCTGVMDSETHMVTFSFDRRNTCGTEVVMNNSQVIYKNTIMSRNSSMDLITRHDQVTIDFSCYYPEPELKSVLFRIRDSSVLQRIVSGMWNYTVMMRAFTDPGLTRLVRPTDEVRLNQKIWVELKTGGLDDSKVAVVTDSCWATNLPASNGTPRYDLIINRCANPADQTVKVVGNGLGTSNFFSFNMFEFTGKSSEVYLHCRLELCLKQDASCATNCRGGARRRRRSFSSKRADESSALITMAWSH